MPKNAVVVGLLVASLAGQAAGDIHGACPDSSYVEVVFNRTYPDDSQFAGQPYDYVTVRPNGSGETFANANGIDEGDGLLDIEIRIFVRDCLGFPLIGIPPQQIFLFSPDLCICPGGADADAATDINGMATFTGTLKAGGCTTRIDVMLDGLFMGTLMDASGRTVKINSTDQAHNLASPCYTDAQDLAGFASVFGNPATGVDTAGNPNICYDYNEQGASIDASDLAGFASALGAACQ